MTYPPPPGPDGTYPPPPDPPIQAYQPPAPSYPPFQAYQPPAPSDPPFQAYQPPAPSDPPYPSYPAYQAYPYAPAPPTEGLAIASLVVSCAGVVGLCVWGLGGLLGIVGAILGHVARRRIRVSGAGGSGLALAGIIVGWLFTAIAVLGALALFSFVYQENGSIAD